MPRVAIIGVGIIGAALAVRLAEGGAEVTLIDADRLGYGTSRTSFAWLNANRKLPRHYFELNVDGMRAWREFAPEFSAPPWYVRSGNLMWAAGDDPKAELHARVDRLREWGYRASFIDAHEAARLEPALREPAETAIAYFPDEGYIDGARAVAALVDRAAAAGARVVARDAVVGFRTARGRVTGVRLASGESVTVDTTVCCAGWRTPRLLEPLGVDIPLVAVDEPDSTAPCVVATTTAVSPQPTRIIHAPSIYARPTGNGSVLLESADMNGRVDHSTSNQDLRDLGHELLRRGTLILPGLDRARLDTAALCVRPLPRDGHPIVGWIPKVTGIYVIVSHSGATLAAVLAALAAAEIVGDTQLDRLAPYRLNRFTDH